MISRTQFISSTQQEIMNFSGPYASEKKTMALEMMDHGLAWSSLSSSTGKLDRRKRRQYKKECRQYILDNYKAEPQVSGFVLSSVVFWFLFNMILKWVINQIIDNYVLSDYKE